MEKRKNTYIIQSKCIKNNTDIAASFFTEKDNLNSKGN